MLYYGAELQTTRSMQRRWVLYLLCSFVVAWSLPNLTYLLSPITPGITYRGVASVLRAFLFFIANHLARNAFSLLDKAIRLAPSVPH